MLKKAASAPHPNGADYLYMGILHDTSRFSRSDAEIEAAGSKLLAMGADHRYVMRTMQDKTLDDLIRQGEILRRVKRVMEGKVAYVYMSYQEAKKLHISYEDIHPISGMLRDCEDIEMGFSMYEEAPNIWRLISSPQRLYAFNLCQQLLKQYFRLIGLSAKPGCRRMSAATKTFHHLIHIYPLSIRSKRTSPNIRNDCLSIRW